MREPISGAWLIQIVVAFVLLFSGYLALSVNYSRSFKMKNDIVSMIENNQGISGVHDPIFNSIRDHMNSVGFRAFGRCPVGNGWHGLPAAGPPVAVNVANNTFLLCIQAIDVVPADDPQLQQRTYFRIKTFFNLDLPLFNMIFNLNIDGDTRQLNTPGLN